MQKSFQNRFKKVDWETEKQIPEPISVKIRRSVYNFHTDGDMSSFDLYPSRTDSKPRISLFWKGNLRKGSQMVAKIGKGKGKFFKVNYMEFEMKMPNPDFSIYRKIDQDEDSTLKIS